MLLLDTNVISELMRTVPDPTVAGFIAGQAGESLFTTTISQAEILAGLAVMPAGGRRRALEAAAHAMFQEDFEGRILPFDRSAAVAYAGIFARRRAAGKTVGSFDLMIAGIAYVTNATIVSRNGRDFEGSGVAVLNPWDG